MVVLTPEPVSWDMWCSVTGNHRNVHLASLQPVGDCKSPADSLAQRAKKPSAGGDMAAFSPVSGLQRELPPRWSPGTIDEFHVGPHLAGRVAREEYGQIL